MRFYLVQDFEPWFYPAGGSARYDTTYRMGFHAITVGRSLRRSEGPIRNGYRRLSSDATESVITCWTAVVGEMGSFLCQTSRTETRIELGLLELQLFAERDPNITIHFNGKRSALTFPFNDHGVVPRSELNPIYNRCLAGLSLLDDERSACSARDALAGCIP